MPAYHLPVDLFPTNEQVSRFAPTKLTNEREVALKRMWQLLPQPTFPELAGQLGQPTVVPNALTAYPELVKGALAKFLGSFHASSFLIECSYLASFQAIKG